MIPVRGPAQEESAIRLVHHDLENPGHIPAGRDVAKKTRVENVGLLLSHGRRPTPIRPARFGVLIVVVGREVNCRMYKAEDEIIGGPVDDEIYSHVVGVDSYFIPIGPKVLWTLVAKEATHAREARITHSDGGRQT